MQVFCTGRKSKCPEKLSARDPQSVHESQNSVNKKAGMQVYLVQRSQYLTVVYGKYNRCKMEKGKDDGKRGGYIYFVWGAELIWGS